MYSSVLLFLNIGSSEMVLIVFVALLLFGGEKLPEIARGLGKGIRDFKDASDGVKREINNQINSYEDKREEDKRVEDAIISNQQSAQGQLTSHTGELNEGHVENTMPVKDNLFTEDKNAPAENHLDVPAVHEADNKVSDMHSGSSFTQPVKNT